MEKYYLSMKRVWFEGNRDEFPSVGNIDIFKY